MGHVHATLGVDLDGPEHGEVEPAAVIEIELRGLVDDRLGKVAASEAQARGRDPADGAALDGEGELPEPSRLRRHRRDRFGQADAEIDDVTRAHLLQSPRPDDLAFGKTEPRHCGEVVTGLNVAGIEGFAEGLLVPLTS